MYFYEKNETLTIQCYLASVKLFGLKLLSMTWILPTLAQSVMFENLIAGARYERDKSYVLHMIFIVNNC